MGENVEKLFIMMNYLLYFAFAQQIFTGLVVNICLTQMFILLILPRQQQIIC
uniref:Uncharacterized protein n=1 Tax=Meloidogyne enterolobii TaxID=390850 RepID=A0A6V7Y8D2_MELEN|nr:unnamed protein product [Meloidogyne enterolobii]